VRRAASPIDFFEELLEAGVRIYEYQPTMLHSKIVVADGQWSIVGSPNMDIRSKELNEENVLGIQDVGFARQLEASFLDDLKHSKEFHLDEWRKRGAWERFREWLAGRFVEYY
jgi:cardiolipin synthase